MKPQTIPMKIVIFSVLVFAINIANKMLFYEEIDEVKLTKNSIYVVPKPYEAKKKIFNKRAMIIHGMYCDEIDNLLVKDWDVYIRMNDNFIISCQTKENFESVDFIERFIANGGERLAVFKSLPTDLSIWTNQYTLYIPDSKSTFGHVCKDRSYTLTMETGDYTMNNWNIPFHIKDRKVRYSYDANFILEKELLWLLPFFEKEEMITPILKYLSLRSIIRTIDNRNLKRKIYLDDTKNSINIQVFHLKFLKSLEQTPMLKKFIQFIEKPYYNDSLNVNPQFEGNKFCSSVVFKETGKMPVQDPDCHEIKMNVTLKGQVPMRDDMLLVVVYNRVHYDNIGYVNSIYGKLFKYIAYCGSNTIPGDFNRYFATYPHTNGQQTGIFGNMCTSIYLAMKHKHTDALLVISDDILINTHLIDGLPLKKFWIVGNLFEDIRKVIKQQFWGLWARYKKSTIDLLEKLHASNDVYLKNCANILREKSGHNYTFVGGYSDTYYVPYIFSEKFIRVNDFFLENGNPFEMAIPTMFHCFNNTQLLSETRRCPIDKNVQWFVKEFLPKNFYVHPVKWGYLLEKNEKYSFHRDVFCRARAYLTDKSKNPKILKYDESTKS